MTITIGASQILLALAHEGPEIFAVNRASERSLEMCLLGFLSARHAIAGCFRIEAAVPSRRCRVQPAQQSDRRDDEEEHDAEDQRRGHLVQQQAKPHPARDKPAATRCGAIKPKPPSTPNNTHGQTRPWPLEQPREEQAEQDAPRCRPSRGRNRASPLRSSSGIECVPSSALRSVELEFVLPGVVLLPRVAAPSCRAGSSRRPGSPSRSA